MSEFFQTTIKVSLTMIAKGFADGGSEHAQDTTRKAIEALHLAVKHANMLELSTINAEVMSKTTFRAYEDKSLMT
jgi:hypothetical protein